MCYAPGMSPRTPALLTALLVALPAVPALTACGGAEPPAKAAAKHSCTIMVAKKAPAEVKGSGSSEDKTASRAKQNFIKQKRPGTHAPGLVD